MTNPNTHKTKNWMNRLRQLSIRRNPGDPVDDDFTTVVFRRPPADSDTTTCSRTRNSFRKSLRKMQARVKNVFMNNNVPPSSRHTIHISASSASSQSRVTLSSPTTHVENIYSIEPIKKESIAEEPIFEIPPRVINDQSLYSNSYESPISAEGPLLTPRRESRRNFPQLSEIQNGRVPKVEVVSLSNCYWYWGPISRMQAEDRLRNFPDGAFLIRDSSSDKYIFTMSFRSVGRTLHTRIELNKNGYSLFNQGGYHSVAELVNDALTKSKNGVYCYTKSTDEISPNYPVRLTLPVSRYDKVASLKHLSRFVIRQCISINDTEKLPLPRSLLVYIKEDGSYF
ncbi:cytokine-inducible SH2-containing protein [Anoplophora glabripennis]|uniref:cytokine-inducible SH2-containing protein n=1 Tax=Anoplophora glabripennis TaxID=217634 RepID=UPI0008742514|nr:cytokine-inducible SH2-containing protein [Anoplophora glabripennis]